MDPRERVLRSNQIGHSNHRNVYNPGVLEANWVEDRHQSQHTEDISNGKQEYLSTSHYFHDKKQCIPVSVVNRNLENKLPSAKEIEPNHFVSMNTMTYGAGIRCEDTYNLYGTQLQHSPVEELVSAQKGINSTLYALGNSLKEGTNTCRNDKKDYLTTTYKETMSNVPQQPVVTSRSTKKWGEVTRDLDDQYRKMDLRGEYPLKLTPMIKKN